MIYNTYTYTKYVAEIMIFRELLEDYIITAHSLLKLLTVK